MRHILTGLGLLAALTATAPPAAAHDSHHRYHYAPTPRYVMPAPRYYYPAPTYYYAPAPVYVFPRHSRHYRPHHAYRHHRPYHRTPQGSATFFFRF